MKKASAKPIAKEQCPSEGRAHPADVGKCGHRTQGKGNSFIRPFTSHKIYYVKYEMSV